MDTHLILLAIIGIIKGLGIDKLLRIYLLKKKFPELTIGELESYDKNTKWSLPVKKRDRFNDS